MVEGWDLRGIARSRDVARMAGDGGGAQAPGPRGSRLGSQVVAALCARGGDQSPRGDAGPQDPAPLACPRAKAHGSPTTAQGCAGIVRTGQGSTHRGTGSGRTSSRAQWGGPPVLIADWFDDWAHQLVT